MLSPMLGSVTAQPLEDRWGDGPPPGADTLGQLVYLSNIVGREPRLVQPGGGNTSAKSGDTLLVKGSGTDLRTIGRDGFTQLSLASLSALRSATSMLDAEMMRFMAGCMLQPGPAPSVETPLHSLLPHRVIVHTHDVATMSLTNVAGDVAERILAELFSGEIVMVPYVRPGFPLAQAVSRIVDLLGSTVFGLALAHHGLIIWGDDPHTCYARLLRVINRIEDYLATRRQAMPVRGPSAPIPPLDQRRRCAEVALPVVRGELGAPHRVILHLDDGDDMLAVLAEPGTSEKIKRGMSTPEHILRAGRLPVWLDVDPAAPADAIAKTIRTQLGDQRTEYEQYHARHATAGTAPLNDWAKVVLAPGLGMITAARDKRSAVTANLCYRAVLESMANADAIGGFQFIAESEVFEFEHWQLERRKIDEQDARDRATLLLPRHVAVVIGGGSGIGKAAALRFAREGAHVAVADVDAVAAGSVAAEINKTAPGRAIAVTVDVRNDESLATLIRQTVFEFGGIDCLFYTPGRSPRFAGVTDLRREDLQQQLDVHYVGGVLAIGAAGVRDAPTGVGRVDHRVGLQGGARTGPRRGRLRGQQGRAAAGHARRRRGAGSGPDSRERDQRRPGRNADVHAVREGTRRHARDLGDRSVGILSPPECDGRVADSRRRRRGHRGAARERPVPLHHRRYHHDRWRPVRRVSPLTTLFAHAGRGRLARLSLRPGRPARLCARCGRRRW